MYAADPRETTSHAPASPTSAASTSAHRVLTYESHSEHPANLFLVMLAGFSTINKLPNRGYVPPGLEFPRMNSLTRRWPMFPISSRAAGSSSSSSISLAIAATSPFGRVARGVPGKVQGLLGVERDDRQTRRQVLHDLDSRHVILGIRLDPDIRGGQVIEDKFFVDPPGEADPVANV